MKSETLMYAMIVFGVLLLQDTVDGDKSVSNKKMKQWSDESNILNKDDINIGAVDVKNNPELAEKGGEMERLIEVIQFVVTDAFNTDEFRKFIIKRFLHNYLPQVKNYMKKTKKLIKQMDPNSTYEENNKVGAMNSQ